MGYECKIIADSISPAGVRLTTMQVTFPRFVLAEMNTHRAFSRNYESSRAMSVERMIERVKSDPVIPVRWTATSKAMGDSQEVSEELFERCAKDWDSATYYAVRYAERLNSKGVHKNIVNRLLEPFSWVTGIITATDWDNFFTLRCHPDAQPEIRKIAEMMRDARDCSVALPSVLHTPYVELVPLPKGEFYSLPVVKRLSAARCARVSYGRPGEGEVDLADKLQASGHWSPFEHQAIASVNPASRFYNLRGWRSYRYELQEENG